MYLKDYHDEIDPTCKSVMFVLCRLADINARESQHFSYLLLKTGNT